MQNLCLFPLGKKQVNGNDTTRKKKYIYNSFTLRHFIPVHLNSLEGRSAECISKQGGTSPLELPDLSIIASELQKLFTLKGLPFLISLCDTHSLQLLEQFFCLLALKSFVFCQNSFSGVWLWHCSKPFNKHLNSFLCDKSHGYSSSCLVAAWHFPKRLWDSPLAFLF